MLLYYCIYYGSGQKYYTPDLEKMRFRWKMPPKSIGQFQSKSIGQGIILWNTTLKSAVPLENATEHPLGNATEHPR